MTLNKQALPAEVVERLRDLIGQYLDLGYAEGAIGRAVDTMAGEAQVAWSEIDALITSLEAENARLREERAVLTEALEPFADVISKGWGSSHADHVCLTVVWDPDHYGGKRVPLRYFRRARTALNPKGVSDNG